MRTDEARMGLTARQREIIGRGTMGVAAVVLAVAATALVRFVVRVEWAVVGTSSDDDLLLARLLLPVAIFLYLVAGTFAVFVFTPMDKSKSNPARSFRYARIVREAFEDWMFDR